MGEVSLRGRSSSGGTSGKVCVEGEPAIVGRFALIDSCSLLARVLGGCMRVGVAMVLDEMDEDECDELRESTRRTVAGESADICIGGRLAACRSAEAVSSTEPSVCERGEDEGQHANSCGAPQRANSPCPACESSSSTTSCSPHSPAFQIRRSRPSPPPCPPLPPKALRQRSAS